MHKIELADMAAWQEFVDANHEALVEHYESTENALQHAMQGGLTLGGGASPMFHIYFAE